jgi:hypothetical protein
MKLLSLFRRCCLPLLASPLLAAAQGALENPQPDATESGVSVISGWHCTASTVTVSIDGTSLGKAGSGTLRPDTAGVCGGKTQTGYALLTNFSRLTPGVHKIEVFVDGVLSVTRNFRTVRSGGVEFLQGAVGQFVMSDFPTVGKQAVLDWSQARQSFVVTDLINVGDEVTLACNMLAKITGTWSMRYTIASEFNTTLRFTGIPTPYDDAIAPCVMSGTDAAGNANVGVAYSPYSGQYVVVKVGQTYDEVYAVRATTPTRLDGYYYQQFTASNGPVYTAYGVKTASSGDAPGLSIKRLRPLDLELLKLEESTAVSALRTQPDAQREPEAAVRDVVARLRAQLGRTAAAPR